MLSIEVTEILERVEATGATHVTVEIDGNTFVTEIADAIRTHEELPMGVSLELISVHWDMEEAEKFGKDYSAKMGTFQVSKDDLATLGAQVVATLAFHSEWNSQTFEALELDLKSCGITPSDLGQARELCELMGLNPRSYGDRAPQVEFSGHGCPGYGTELEAKIREQLTKRADGERTGNPEDVDDANQELVRLMTDYAGITL